MKIDGVFSGGGIKAYAFVGSLKSIHAHNLSFQRVAGTSAGSIIAGLIASDYKITEIEKLLNEIHLKAFLDPPKLTRIIPGAKWIYFYFEMGLYRGRKFERWLYDKLALKNVYTFGDLPKGRLKVVVSDLSLGKLITIPDDLKRVYGLQPTQFSVARAIRMSIGFPYFFTPKKIMGKNQSKSLIVDGGLLSNFPMWVFEDKSSQQTRPLLGIKLGESTDNTQPRKIRNAVEMLESLFLTMKQAHDTRYISKTEKNNIIFIPTKEFSALDFKINDNEINELIKLGETHTNQFLKYWPK